jgi:hypothetical protein
LTPVDAAQSLLPLVGQDEVGVDDGAVLAMVVLEFVHFLPPFLLLDVIVLDDDVVVVVDYFSSALLLMMAYWWMVLVVQQFSFGLCTLEVVLLGAAAAVAGSKNALTASNVVS